MINIFGVKCIIKYESPDTNRSEEEKKFLSSAKVLLSIHLYSLFRIL